VRSYRDHLLPQRQDNLNLSRDAYRLGKTSFLSVLEAQRDYLAARREYIGSLFDGARSLIALEQVTGQPLSKILQAIPESATRKDGESNQ
ncbi:MAG: TolC family protein, partial [Planctomycetota bacterium]|nr:TolC family protein [Planctomycetota bacterium]